MKYLVHSLIALFLIFSPITAMDNPNPARPERPLGWFESWLPGTFATAEKSTDAFKKISEDGRGEA